MSYDIPIINGNPCRGAIRADAAIDRTPDVPTLGPSVNVGTPPTSGLLVITGGQVYARPSNYYPHPPAFDVVESGVDPTKVQVVTAVYGQVDPTTLNFDFDTVLDFPVSDLPYGFVQAGNMRIVLPPWDLVTLNQLFITIVLPDDVDLSYQFVFPNHLNFVGSKQLLYNTWSPIARAP